MDIEPLDATFGAIVRDVRIADVDDETFAAMHAAWLDRGLLIFPGQFVTRDEQNAFARRFGNLEFEAAPIANIGRDGSVHSATTTTWSSRCAATRAGTTTAPTCRCRPRARCSAPRSSRATARPPGWADMRAAYDALDPVEQERLAGLRAYHSLYYSQGRSGYLPSKKDDGSYGQYGYHDGEPSLRPLVKVHPDTGRPNLLIGRHAYGIEGMEADESEKFLDELNEWACAERADVVPPVGGRRRGDLGQPPADAPGDAVRHDRAAADVAHAHRRRAGVRAGRQPPLSGGLRRSGHRRNATVAFRS